MAMEYGMMTHKLDPALTFVPTVTLDGKQGSPEEQDAMVKNLLKFVCDLWKKKTGKMPAGCMMLLFPL